MADRRGELVRDAKIFANVFEIDDFGRFLQLGHQPFEFAEIDEASRRDDCNTLSNVCKDVAELAAPDVKFSMAGTRP